MFRDKRVLIALLIVFAISLTIPVFAATKARTASTGKGIAYVVGNADLSSGDTQEVDSDGNAMVQQWPGTIGVAVADGTLSGLDTACVVYAITYSGSNPGDRAVVYDARAATGTPRYRLVVGSGSSTVHVAIPGGATFSTTVFVDITADVNNPAEQITFVYDS